VGAAAGSSTSGSHPAQAQGGGQEPAGARPGFVPLYGPSRALSAAGEPVPVPNGPRQKRPSQREGAAAREAVPASDRLLLDLRVEKS
jgi:hypothetical protein